MNNLEKEITNTLKKATDNINPTDNLLISIKNSLNEERELKDMKKLNFKPKTLLITLAVTAILATGVIASNGLGGIISSSDNRDAITHFPTTTEIEKLVDYSPKYVENLQGYEFKSAQPSDTADVDEAGNKTNKRKEVSFYYESDKGILSLHTSPVEYEYNKTGEAISYKGNTIYYTSTIYKAVPPEYVKTAEDIELEEKGELQIGFGASKISEEKTQSIVWIENGITYDLLDMGIEIEKNTFIEMAKQVIDAE